MEEMKEMKEMEVMMQTLGNSAETRFVVKMPDGMLTGGRNKAYMEVTARDLIIKAIADRYFEENYVAISALIDPQAIANLAIAGVAKEFLQNSLKKDGGK